MSDYSKMTDDELNEAIFKAKGWMKLEFPAFPKWQRPIRDGEVDEFGKGVTGWYELVPDYTHGWRLCGDLLEEMLNCSLRRWGDKWCCGFYDHRGYLLNQVTVHDTPQRAICEAWLAWKELQ